MHVVYTRMAIKDLRAIPAQHADLIRSKIEQYAADPLTLANVVSKLQGRAGLRLRVGNYRVIIEEDGAVLCVLRIGHRSNVYD